MRLGGLEPPTFSLRVNSYHQLSYKRIFKYFLCAQRDLNSQRSFDTPPIKSRQLYQLSYGRNNNFHYILYPRWESNPAPYVKSILPTTSLLRRYILCILGIRSLFGLRHPNVYIALTFSYGCFLFNLCFSTIFNFYPFNFFTFLKQKTPKILFSRVWYKVSDNRVVLSGIVYQTVFISIINDH